MTHKFLTQISGKHVSMVHVSIKLKSSCTVANDCVIEFYCTYICKSTVNCTHTCVFAINGG